MRDNLLNLIPNDLLNLIWKNIKPSVKYSVNKYYFKKFYCVRFAYINNNNFIYNKVLSNSNFYIIKKFNYIKYLIVQDCNMILENIINFKLSYDINNYIFKNAIYFESKKFKNFIDFCYFYCKKFNSNKCLDYLYIIIKKYELNYLLKKEHKNNINKNNKAIKWKI